MGNFWTKETKEDLRCNECAQQNIEPEYFTKKLNGNFICEIKDEERYDKYGNEIKNNSLEKKSVRPQYFYVCSNGHKINN